jgi:hypothetical protein
MRLQAIKDELIQGYRAASEFTGLTYDQLFFLVKKRRIRCFKPYRNAVAFLKSELLEDINAMRVDKVPVGEVSDAEA